MSSKRASLGFLALAIVIASAPAHAAARAAKKPVPKAAPTSRELTAADLKGLAWRSVGPANMGGRVPALAFVPGSRTSFYVGYASGGVFKTENLGVTFQSVFDECPVLSIGAIAVADAPADWPGWKAEVDSSATAKPDDPERGKGKIVWVGTGEANNRNSSSWGNGVYRSTDGGASFTHLGLDATQEIARVAVDPRNPDVCFVAALGHLWGANPERGIYKTTDGGKTWQQVLKIDAATGACDVAIDPRAPETVYAALHARRRTPWSFTGNSETGGIFRSDDGGRSWKKLANGLPSRTGRIGLSIFPGDPRILYAVVESDLGGTGRDAFEDRSATGGLFRTEDRGETWTRVSDYNFRPFYFSQLAIDPKNDRRVYLPGWDLALSDDGGKTFRRSGSENVHVDFHAIAVNPEDPAQILIGTDGGVYISHDRAKTWDHLNNVAVGQFYRIALDDSDPYRIAGGLQDNGSWMGPSATLWKNEGRAEAGILNEDWQVIGGGDGFTVAFDPTDRNRIYVTSQGADLVRRRLDTNVARLIKPAPGEGQERFRFNWNAPYLVSKHDPTVLYLGGNRVFKLRERGNKWSTISTDLSRREVDKIQTVGSDAETYGTVVSLAESPLQKGLLWAGTDDGLVHVTADEGSSWQNVTPKQAGGLYVSRIAPSWQDAKTAYVALDGHRSDIFKPVVVMTENLGRTWTDITGDLPSDEPVQVVFEDPGNSAVLYVGTEFGVYVTLNRGRSWIRLNGKSLPPAPVDDIQFHPRERDLVLGTHGRSIWILDDASCFAQMKPETLQKPLAVFDILPGKPRLYRGRAYGAGHGLFRAKNPAMGAMIQFWLRDDPEEDASIAITDSTGFMLRKLDSPTRRGLNRVVWDLQADKKHLFSGPDQDLDQTQFVPAGTYKVTVTVGREKAQKTVKVLPAPEP